MLKPLPMRLFSFCIIIIIGVMSNFPLNVKAVVAFSADISSGNVYYLKNVYSQKYLEIRGSSLSSDIYQYDYMGSPNQQFKLILAEGTGSDSYYRIAPLINETLRVDINNASNKNGEKVKSFRINDAYSHAQRYKFISNDDGTYRIMPKLSNSKVLEIAGPSQNNYAMAQIWDYVGADNQKWIMSNVIQSQQEKLEVKCVPYSNPKNTSSVTLHIKNSSHSEIMYGENFKLEKYNGKSWQTYPYRTDKELSDFAEAAYVLQSNTETDINIRLTDYEQNDVPISSGKYRILKEFTGDLKSDGFPVVRPTSPNTYLYLAEFEIS